MPYGIKDFLGTYGGTDESLTWVFACVSLIASEVASYPWHIETDDEDEMEREKLPPELVALLSRPNPDLTYFDWISMAMTDLELAGNTYWYREDQNKLGQPKALRRLRPEHMRVAAGDKGEIIGYVYDFDSIPVPYDTSEVLRITYPNPLDDYYGMGTVEAIQRTLAADLAETEHIVGFFQDGARISGVLSVSETLSEPQFERMKNSFRTEYVGQENAFKVLIAEAGTNYSPITSTPADLGVVELRRATKDEILSAFGVPEFLLGGAAQGGVYKMSEAQHILTRLLMPKVRRLSEKLTADLIRAWGEISFHLDQTVAEAFEQRLEKASGMLGVGASMDEIRGVLELPLLETPESQEPIINGGVILWSQLVAQAEQAAAPPPEPLPPEPAIQELPEGDVIEGEAVEVAGEIEAAASDTEIEQAAKGVVPPFRYEAPTADLGARVAAGLRALAGHG